MVLLFVSRSTAYAPADLRSVELGLPLVWVTQDQSYFDAPSYPYEVSFVSTWEHPTMVDLLLLLANMLIISGVLWLLSLGWRRFSSRSQAPLPVAEPA